MKMKENNEIFERKTVGLFNHKSKCKYPTFNTNWLFLLKWHTQQHNTNKIIRYRTTFLHVHGHTLNHITELKHTSDAM